MTETRLDNEAATIAYATKLAGEIQPGQVITLSGELGAGKSVFARAMMRALGVTDEALPSPTFAIIQEYEGQTCQVAHMDWYRLEDAYEIEMLGVRGYFESPWVTIIEWPERAPDLLPENTIRFHLSCVDGDLDARLIRKDGAT